MDDLALSELLSSRGFEGEGAERALERLHRDGLTRPGKTRIAAAKIEAADRALGAAFARHCRQPACLPSPGETREPVLVSTASPPRIARPAAEATTARRWSGCCRRWIAPQAQSNLHARARFQRNTKEPFRWPMASETTTPPS